MSTAAPLSTHPAVNGQPVTVSPPTSPVPVGVNAASGNPADNNITSPTVAAAAAIASRKMGTDGKDSLTTFINEFTNDASNWSILDANTRDQRIADWRAFRRGFIWRQFWDGLFKSRHFIDDTGTAISQRADGHFAASPEGKGVRGAIAKRHGENKKIARQQQTAVYAENLKVFKEHRPLLEALIDLQGKDVYHEGAVEVKPEPMDPLSSDDLYGRIAHRKLYKRAVNDQDIKTERPHRGYRWGALDVITFPFAGILTYDLRAKQAIPPNEQQSGRVVLPAAQGTIFSVSSCVSNVRRDAAQSLAEINGLVEENKVHANDRRLRRVLWALSDQIIKCKKYKRPLGVDDKRSGVSTKIIQGTLSVGYPDPTAARTLEPDGCGLYFNVKVVKSGGCMSKAVDELVPHGQIDAKSIMELNKPLWEKAVAEADKKSEEEHNKMRLDLYEKQHTLSYDFMVRVYTQPGHAEFFVPNPQMLYDVLCDTEKIDAFAGDAKYPARAGADHPLVKYLFPNGPHAPRQELIDVYNRINSNPSVGELYWLKTWVGVIRSMKLREREKRLKERETKRLRERKQEQQERMEQERLEREFHQNMQKWQDNPLPESEKGPKPVRPVHHPTSLAVAPSANPAIDLFAVEPAIDYSNFQSIAYQPSRLPQLMERLSKLTEILSRPSTSAPAEIFYTKLYQRLRVLEPDNANWADTTATPPQPSPPPAVVQPVINDGKKKKKAHGAHDDRAKATSPTLASPQAASPANGHTDDGDDEERAAPPKAVVVANGHTHDDDANSESGDEAEAKDTADHKRAAKPAAAVVAATPSTKKDGKKKAAGDDDAAARRERAEQRSCARSMCFSFSSDEKPADTKKAAPVPSATAKDAGAAKTTKKAAGPKATSKAKSKSKAKK